MHLVLDSSCPPLQPLKWEEKGRERTGGADEGVPRSPAGVDPKETPLITKHLAGKLRTRHEQRLVTRRQADRGWRAARIGLASCGWRERRMPTQVIFQSQPQDAETLGLCIRSLGCMASLWNSMSFSREMEKFHPLHFEYMLHGMWIQAVRRPGL